jgi:hypothetical protein
MINNTTMSQFVEAKPTKALPFPYQGEGKCPDLKVNVEELKNFTKNYLPTPPRVLSVEINQIDPPSYGIAVYVPRIGPAHSCSEDNCHI